MKILIVEDEAGGRKLLEMMLGRDHDVTAVENVDMALEHLQVNHWDLILTDYKMPGKTGVELIQSLHSSGSTIPIILMTGQSSKDDGVDQVKAMVHKVLPKPFSRKELAAVVDSLDPGHAASGA